MATDSHGPAKVLAAAVLGALLCVGSSARAFASPVAPLVAERAVKVYFDALHRQDVGTLGSVTSGDAARSTRAIIDRIHDESSRYHVGVELKVKSLSVKPLPSTIATVQAEQAHVAVNFDVAVIAKKWLLSKVATELRGHATFVVGKNIAKGDISSVKIVGIAWSFD